jgi:hypothetical protein
VESGLNNREGDRVKYIIVVVFLLTCTLLWACSTCDKWVNKNGGRPPKKLYEEGYKLGYKTYKDTHSEEWDVFDCGWKAGEEQAKKDLDIK